MSTTANCEVFDHRNPGVASREIEQFYTFNCLPPYLQLVSYSIFLFVDSLLVLWNLYIIIKCLRATKLEMNATISSSVLLFISTTVRCTTFLSSLFFPNSPWKLVSTGFSLAFLFITSSITIYSWLSFTNMAQFYSQRKQEITGSLTNIKRNFLLFNLLLVPPNFVIWSVAAYYRTFDIDKSNWAVAFGYVWFGLGSCLPFSIISFISIKRFRTILSEYSAEHIQKVLKRMKLVTHAQFILATSVLCSIVVNFTWFLLTRKGHGMSYFFGPLFLIFIPSESCVIGILLYVLNLQVNKRMKRVGKMKNMEEKVNKLELSSTDIDSNS